MKQISSHELEHNTASAVSTYISSCPKGKTNKMANRIMALVVDDNLLNQRIHSTLLNKHGIETEVMGNGKEAVDAHLSGKKFDLILMDRDMPVMNGIQATRKLREMGVRSIIVGLSSHSSEQVKEFMEAGLNDYQEKPLTLTKLTSILQRWNLNL
ncbi:hypothetical protein QUC31_014398 [Theobroma cacao]|uniref:Two-component response regulator ARR22 n=2 Tax=Theobroma cacao TaxID=3641 RepID=A0AB32VJQ3_THECC|nr:PREDICTED: two-component response regulator ARR22 [Theobroma cacao]EOY00106.1 Response regulator 24, putative [Theobroma cacao]WRX15980.1 Signal transduction response regulator [Theobroma cacao]